MTRPKPLIVSSPLMITLILILSTAFASPEKQMTNCDNFKVTVSVDSNNQVDVQVTGLQGKKRLHLVGAKGLAKKDISIEELKKLTKGSYTIIVVDQIDSDNYCQQHFEFTLK